MSLGHWSAVFIGGGLGSICRYAISLLVIKSDAASLPWATLIANVLSCVVMGLVIFYLDGRFELQLWQRLFLLVGFCGGFSTFSTFSLENHALLRAGQTGYLIANIAVSVVLCLGVFYVMSQLEKG